MSLRSSGSITRLRASWICSAVGINTSFKQRANGTPRGAAGEGGEILHCRREYVAGSLTPVRSLQRRRSDSRATPAGGKPVTGSGERAHTSDEALGLTLHLAARGLDRALEVPPSRLHLALRVTPVLLRGAEHAGAALAKLALNAGASALHLAHGAVAGGVAAALELAQIGADATLELVELPFGALATLGVGLCRLDHRIAGDERGANRNQHHTLGLRLHGLDRVALGLGPGSGGLARRLGALRSIPAAGCGGLLRGGRPLGLR